MNSNSNPDVEILGSSLVLVPMVRIDDSYHHVRTRFDTWYNRNHTLEYTHADYFQHKLSEALHKPIDLVNLGIVASVMSDHYIILKKTIASGKRPRLVICGIAPRDFLDNYRGDVEKTPAYQALSDITCLGDLLADKPSLVNLFDFALGKVWYYFGNRGDYRAFLIALASTTTGRPLDLFLAAQVERERGMKKQVVTASDPDQDLNVGILQDTKPDYVAKPNTLEDLQDYKTQVYYPINKTLYAKQMGYLERMLKLAQDSNVPLLLVDMPLTQANLALLPADLLDDYHKRLTELTSKYGATLYRPLTRNDYPQTDFQDSCHMTAIGAKKFIADLIQVISSNNHICSSLTSNGQLISKR